MSSHSLVAVAQRKAQLIERAAAQREAIAGIARAWHTRTRTFDRGVSLLGVVRTHPVLAGAALAVLLIFRRATLLRWAGRAVMVWRGWRVVRSMLGGRALQ